MTLILCGKHASANERAAEAAPLADERGSSHLKAFAMTYQSYVTALTGNALKAVQAISSAIAAWRAIGSTVGLTFLLPYLAHAHAELGNFDHAGGRNY